MSVQDAKAMYDDALRTARSLVEDRGCEVNLCFAIDTSGSVNSTNFEVQKDFIVDITATIGVDSRSKFAAGQYGARTRLISLLTDDLVAFNQAVEKAEFQNDPATSVGSGIVFCDRILRREVGDTNKIVILGDGRNNLGGDPVRRANVFRERARGEVCAVGVGFSRDQDEQTLIDIANGEERVFQVDDYIELTFIVEDLVRDICKFDLILA